MELRELTPGLHRWTAPHPEWKERDDWEQDVGCVSAETADALVLIDPLVPDDGWPQLDALVERVELPVATLLTVEWHVRSADAVRERYRQWDRDGVPDGVVQYAVGIPAFTETLFWLPAHGALVPGDLLIGDGEGGVRVAPASWFSSNAAERTWYREGLARDVAPLLELPVERVLVSHGEPVLAGSRDALAAALR